MTSIYRSFKWKYKNYTYGERKKRSHARIRGKLGMKKSLRKECFQGAASEATNDKQQTVETFIFSAEYLYW